MNGNKALGLDIVVLPMSSFTQRRVFRIHPIYPMPNHGDLTALGQAGQDCADLAVVYLVSVSRQAVFQIEVSERFWSFVAQPASHGAHAIRG